MPLAAELWRDEKSSRLGEARISQPACTALQMALVDLLRTWGVVPGAVIGHSSGEIAAAYTKGALARRDAWAIAYHRGRLAGQVVRRGSMLATGLGAEQAARYVAKHAPRRVVVGCINSPSSTTLSGDAEAINQLYIAITIDGHFARKLRVEVAYHSPHMQAVADDYRHSIAHVATLPDRAGDAPEAKMFSSVRPGLIESNAELGADYWVANMVGQVDFAGGMLALMEQGTKGKPRRRTNKQGGPDSAMVEIGPHSALRGPSQQIWTHGAGDNAVPAASVAYHSVLERGEDAAESALALVGKLYQLGYAVDVAAVNGVSGSDVGPLVDLPPFRWNHSLKYWCESHTARAHRFRKHPRTDLLGSETLEGIGSEPRFRNILRPGEVPWTQQHKVQGSALYPAAGMMVMAIEAMCQRAEGRPVQGYELRDVAINRALVLPPDEDGVETMLTLKPSRDAAWQQFHLYSRREAWESNCSGLIRVDYEQTASPAFANEGALLAAGYAAKGRAMAEACSRHQDPGQFYAQLDSIGLHYGPVFQGLVRICKGDFQAVCTVAVPDTCSTMPHKFEYPHVIHPATLDSILQMALPSCSAIDGDLPAAVVPTGVRRLYVSASTPTEAGAQLPGYAYVQDTDAGGREASIVVSDPAWTEPLVVFEGVRSTAMASSLAGSSTEDVQLRKLTSVFHWQQDVTMLDAADMQRLCAERVGDLGQVDRRLLEELEMACLVYIKRVMAACPAEEAQSMAWNFKLFWEYMRQCYERGQRGELCYQANGSDWLGMSREQEEALLARVAAASTDGAALVAHGEQLPQILRGEVPPLQVLMRGNFLADFYRHGLGTARHYAQLAYFVELLAHQNPNMRILEVGAGTGGASLPVLAALGGAHGTAPRFESYTFTDISAGYFERAREKLAAWGPFVRFAKLDVEADPAAQGFDLGAYDLVIASNVLHATRSLQAALAHTRALLKPEGKLALSEITNPARKMRFHMIVGSLEGWWYGE